MTDSTSDNQKTSQASSPEMTSVSSSATSFSQTQLRQSTSTHAAAADITKETALETSAVNTTSAEGTSPSQAINPEFTTSGMSQHQPDDKWTNSESSYSTLIVSPSDEGTSSSTTADFQQLSVGQSHPGLIAIPIVLLLLVIVGALLGFLYFRSKKQKKNRRHSDIVLKGNGCKIAKTNDVGAKPDGVWMEDEVPPPSCQSRKHQPTTDPKTENRPKSVQNAKKKSIHGNQSAKPKPTSDQSDNQSAQAPSDTGQSENSTPTCEENFVDCIMRHKENLILYQKEFETLPDGSVKSSSVAKTSENIAKNRYINILPFDENRVILSQKTETDSDYVNASFIDGAQKKRAYIAAQGPSNSTLSDFWSMVWENDCNRILMLTNLEETVRGLSTVKTGKCTKYWPSSVGMETKYGDVNVRLLNESVESDWTIRILAARKDDSNSVRIVQQYHYTTWPDQDVPHTSTALLKFHRLSLKSPDALSAAGPTLIHCSAGVGRTGTLIAIDILEDSWDETQPYCDVFRCVEKLRHQRMSMVQSVKQYMFIHHSLIQAFYVGDAAEVRPETMAYYQLTPKHEEQFRIIEATSVTSLSHCSVAKAKAKKNRSSSILPANSQIRFLKPIKEDNNIYINAITVHGFPEQDDFIVTQMPLPETINDLWRLVRDSACAAVVMLNSTFSSEDRYWPGDNEDIMKTKSFSVGKSRTGSHVTDSIVTTELEINFQGDLVTKDDGSSSEDETSSSDVTAASEGGNDLDTLVPNDLNNCSTDRLSWTSVRHLRVIDWPETETFPRDSGLLLTLYEQIVQIRASFPKRPIIVHCLQGAERSGLLCALVNILDRLKEQGIVGIFDSVKLIKERRQQLIPDAEHYNYLHQLVSMYVKRSDGVTDQGVTTTGMTSEEDKEEARNDKKLIATPKEPQVLARQSVLGNDAKQSVKENDARQSVIGTDARQSVKGNDARQSVIGTDAKQSVKENDARQSVICTDAKQSVKENDARQSVIGIDARQSVKENDARQSVIGTDAGQSVKENDAKQSVISSDTRQSVKGNDADQGVKGNVDVQRVKESVKNDDVRQSLKENDSKTSDTKHDDCRSVTMETEKQEVTKV